MKLRVKKKIHRLEGGKKLIQANSLWNGQCNQRLPQLKPIIKMFLFM